MHFISEDLEKYIEQHTSAESEVLKALDRETNLKVMSPRMLSGHVQGQALRMISMMIKPRNILEIGTFTGYSAVCFADGLQPGGKLTTIDINAELEPMVRRYFKEAGVEDKINYLLGNALEIIPTLKDTFDLVFIDADKENYSNYYYLVIDKLPSGAFIIADNVLWSGKVVLPKPDKDTRALMEFNDKVQADDRVENVLFPVRDGFMLIRKK
jgi:predicted O-methyltransferase YrrM